MKTLITSIALVLIITFTSLAQQIMNLYPGSIPNSKQSEMKETVTSGMFRGVTIPTLEIYLPEKDIATGTAVIICPGGGYSVIVYQGEGISAAKEFAKNGVAAFVLKYRLPDDSTLKDKKNGPLQDAQQAIKVVREHAATWGINPNKIGIMGFSAGGHLASTLGTHFDYGNKSSRDSVEQKSCRPDFMILMYPVITFTDSTMHTGSREALLGKNPDPGLARYYSNELQVKEDTPPAFFVHADNDSGVPVENTLLMYKALRKNKIPAELHILSEGEHGFGLGLKTEHVASWTYNLKLWLTWLNTKK